MSAKVVLETFLYNWVLVFGPPRRFLTDQGSCFESKMFHNFCILWKIDKRRTTPYHPQGNGGCERVNQTIKHNLAKLISPDKFKEWDTIFSHAVYAYNTIIHSITGFSTFFLLFGAEA